jgi:hypothetical protein
MSISEVQVMSTLALGRTNNEAIAEDQGLGLSPIGLSSQLLVPAVYGGDGEINEVGNLNDGMGASAEALVQFIHEHAVWGSTPGASAMAVSRGDGIDWAYTINTRDWPQSTSPTLNDLGTSIDTLLNTTPLP